MTDRSGRWLDGCWRLGLNVAYAGILAVRFFRRPKGPGVFVSVWHGDRLLLIRNSYRSGESVPAGGIRRGETTSEAARRELREEVGLEVEPEALKFACTFELDYHFKRDVAHFFELEYTDEPRVEVDRREVTHANFVPRHQLPSRPLVPHVLEYLRLREREAQEKG